MKGNWLQVENNQFKGHMLHDECKKMIEYMAPSRKKSRYIMNKKFEWKYGSVLKAINVNKTCLIREASNLNGNIVSNWKAVNSKKTYIIMIAIN